MMYLVFGRIFKLGATSQYYPLALLIGIVLFTFFSDATIIGMSSLVSRESLLRKLIFPRVIIPTAATLTAAMTFVVNTIVVGGFVAWNQLVPQLEWLLIIALLLELYIFVLGITLIVSTLFVHFRDIGQIWELALQLLFYASPIIYPIGYLPAWARNLAFLNPFTQVLQSIRALIIYPEDVTTATTALGIYGRLIPIGIAFATFLIGLWLFKRQEPYFAERV
jgi:ABC-2 type transport system permease protein